MLSRREALFLSAAALSAGASARSAEPFPGKPAFRHRCFYLHTGWLYNYPFAVRRWKRADYAAMFRLLVRLGFNRVMTWPMTESLPAPLSKKDRAELAAYRDIVADAQAAGLECWIVTCACLTPDPKIADRPWIERNPYRFARTLRMDRSAERDLYLAHRRELIRTLNNADGYVIIDGDPGGYPGAKPDDFSAIFRADRAALDKYGTHPKAQKVIPWVWCGWGTRGVWQEPGGPKGLVPFVRPELEALAKDLPEPSELLIGRSSSEDSANGRVNIELAEKLRLIGRSSLLCYEAVEYEPSPPASVLQFADIRRILKQEGKHSEQARGVCGNAQQVVTVLPNVYLFARAAWQPDYLAVPDAQVLADFAGFLGGLADLLRTAWSALDRNDLPADLPAKLRKAKLGPVGDLIPGGPAVYLDILARHAETLLATRAASTGPVKSADDAAERVAAGTAALVAWWKFTGYVNDGGPETPFRWDFVHPKLRTGFGTWLQQLADKPVVTAQAAELLARRKVLPLEQARVRLREAIGG